MKLKKIAALLAVAGLASPAFATNGMNVHGYGPISAAMGGAAMAYDNGNAGLINNPATLGLMPSNSARVDIALGGLHPDVKASFPAAGLNADSSSKSFFMPAGGYVRKDGRITWGLGMMTQGGMGADYGNNSFMSAGTGQNVRSELGLGRFILPLVFDASDNFRIGGSVDFVWGGLDLNSALSAAQLGGMMGNMGNTNKNAPGFVNSVTPALGAAMAGALGAGATAAYINASEGTNQFKQRMPTNGYAANIGFVYSPSKQLSIGAVYHGRTKLKDMSGNATMGFYTGSVAMGAPMSGTLSVINFQWPETYGIGLSYAPSDKWMFVADYKNIAWSKAMQRMTMRFSTAAGQIEMGFNQNWKDQDVVQLGMAYKMDSAVTLRGGLNLASSPIASSTTTGVMHPLFPAITENHLTLGFGYAMDKSKSIEFSYAYAPKVTAVNQSGVSASHEQQNWQFMFSNRF